MARVITNRSQLIKTHEGGLAFQLTPMQRLEQFIFNGNERGTYYVKPQALAVANAMAAVQAMNESGVEAINTIVDISRQGRAPRNSTALFAMALAMSPKLVPNAQTRRLAATALPDVARTMSHLFDWAGYVSSMRGNGSLLRFAVSHWIDVQTDRNIVFQALKYPTRNGWKVRDLFMIGRPKPENAIRDALYSVAIGKPNQLAYDIMAGVRALTDDNAATWRVVEGYNAAHAAKDVAGVVSAITRYRLSHEFVPKMWQGEPAVWEALWEFMPPFAKLYNLPRMSSYGLATTERLAFLGDEVALNRARIHPMTVFEALKKHQAGKSRQLTWNVDSGVVASLEGAIPLTMPSAPSTDATIVVGVDVSGSMWGDFYGANKLPPTKKVSGMNDVLAFDAASIVALILRSRERNAHLMCFDHRVFEPDLSRANTLSGMFAALSAQGQGNTNCQLPIDYARAKDIRADAIVVLTDSEGELRRRPIEQEMEKYRAWAGKPTRLFVVEMCANGITLGDPRSPLTTRVVGFDSKVLSLISGVMGNAQPLVEDESDE